MSRAVRVTKMSGAGNDFVVIDAGSRVKIEGSWDDWVRRVCRRGLSIGADGVLVVGPGAAGRVRVEFYNPDGGGAFCGNGSRCAARFAVLRGLAGNDLLLETAAGEVRARVDGTRVTLRLPPPRDLGRVDVVIEGVTIRGRRVDSGSPHFVVQVEDVAAYPLPLVGPQVRRHAAFGERGTNFDVIGRATPAGVPLRTWERGVEAETLACGSGAVAAAFALRLEGAAERIRLLTAGGVPLQVALPGPAERPEAAELEGDARVVFEADLAPETTLGF